MGFFGSRSSSEQSKDSNRERQRETSKYTKVSKKAKAKVQTDRDNDSRDKLANYKVPVKKIPAIVPGSTLLNMIPQKVSQKSFEVNRDYFVKNVAGKNGYKNTFESYESYIKGRSGGNLDAMGRATNNNGGGNEGIQLAKAATGSATVKGPGEIQKSAANTKGTTDTTMTAAQINIANKRKGKKVTNQTAKTVLTEDYKLSKKKLLG